MELVFENGWNGNRWMLDRLASFRRGIDEATDPNTPARADVTEDKDAYHFYRFRCKAFFEVGWANGTVTIVGRNRAVWRWT